MTSSNIHVIVKHAADALLQRLDFMTLQPDTILMTGPSSDYSMPLLKMRYPRAHILVVNDEMALLPYQDHSVDFIFSVMALPFCDDLQKIFQAWRRVMRPEGLLMFASLGPDTLSELKGQHLLYLPDMHDVGDMLLKAQWSEPVMDAEYLTLAYSEEKQLFAEMQMLNISVSNDVKVEKNSERYFPLTFEIVYGHAWAVEPQARMDETGVARFPLSRLRRR